MSDPWPRRPLGELFEIGAGKTMSAAARNGSTKTPFLRTSNVLWDEIDLSTVDEMSIAENELPAKLLRPGDLLVCEGGEIGRAAIWNGQVATMSFQNHLHRLRPIVDGVEPRFYVFFLHCAFTQLGIFEGAGNKTTIPNLSRNRLALLEVPEPRLEEQREVVALLAHVRTRIKIQNQLLALVRELERTVSRNLFAFGLRGEQQRTTEVGLIPQSWTMSSIGDVTNRIQYGLSMRGTPSGRYPILRMNCQEEGRVVLRDLQYVDVDEETVSTYRLCPGDVLFNRTNSHELVGRTAIVEFPTDAVFASYLLRLAADRRCLDPRFLNYFLNSESAQVRLKALATRGVSQSNISASKLRALSIPLPSLREQQRVSEVLDVIHLLIDARRRYLDTVLELYRTLLLRVMTQAIHVSRDDIRIQCQPG